MRRWKWSVVAVMVALLVAACTPEPPTPKPTPTPSPSPTLRAAEKDVREAVTAYYEGFDEVIRLLKSPGPDGTTATLKRTMSGPYLKSTQELVGREGYLLKGTPKIAGYAVGAQTATDMVITGCEDSSESHMVDTSTGKDLSKVETDLLVLRIKAKKSADGLWKIHDYVSTRYVTAEDWSNQVCMSVKERPDA